ncbi:hypothetical protein D3C85_1598460 [compost metagenome]
MDFFCTVGSGNDEVALSKFTELFDLIDLKMKELSIKGNDGGLHKFGIENSEMEVNSLVDVDEDIPNKYKNVDYQIGSLAVSSATK